MALYCRRSIICTAYWVLSVIAAPSLLAYEIYGSIKVSHPQETPQVITIKQKSAPEVPDQVLSQILKTTSEGFLENAVISIEGVEGTIGESEEALAYELFVLDQKDYIFHPHVITMPKKAVLKIVNSDPAAHDVRIFNEAAKMIHHFSFGNQGDFVEVHLKSPGTYVIRCGLHKWMHAIVKVMPHPYFAVSDAKGRFRLSGLPEGKYTVKVWHELLGEVHKSIELKEPLTLFSFTYQNSKSN